MSYEEKNVAIKDYEERITGFEKELETCDDFFGKLILKKRIKDNKKGLYNLLNSTDNEEIEK